jgi:hypothetical protein
MSREGVFLSGEVDHSMLMQPGMKSQLIRIILQVIDRQKTELGVSSYRADLFSVIVEMQFSSKRRRLKFIHTANTMAVEEENTAVLTAVLELSGNRHHQSMK